MKKKYIKRFAGILLLVLAVCGIAYVMQYLVCNRNDSECLRVRAFYMEPEDSLDVVVLGASEIMTGYAPAEAYRTCGFTSYPYAVTINSVPLWKYELEDIERTQHPQVLIVETNGALYKESKYIHNDHCLDTVADNMPMSMNRVRMASDLSEHPLERLFPILKYHYKWKEILDLSDNNNLLLWKEGHAKLRGVQSRLYRDDYSADDLYPLDGTTADLNEDAEPALREFLEVCKESGIEHILFVEYPHVINDKDGYARQQRANRAGEIIREAGFEYIDFNENIDEIGLDLIGDFSDTNHMCARGQKKFTKYLAELIMEKYDLQPRAQTDENRAGWEESVELIDKYYKLYEDYTAAHADEPYEKAEFQMGENYRTMEELAKIELP